MASAAAVIRACRRELAAGNAKLLDEIAPGGVCDRQRYPAGEASDRKSTPQYFFHANAESGGQDRELGHFHPFLRAEGIPRGVAPLPPPELAVPDVVSPLPPQAAPLKRGTRDEVSHLIAIAI